MMVMWFPPPKKKKGPLAPKEKEKDQGWYSEHRFNSVVTFVLNTVLNTQVTTPLKQLLNGILSTVLALF